MGRRTESEVQSPRSKARRPKFGVSRVFRGKPEALERGSVGAVEAVIGRCRFKT